MNAPELRDIHLPDVSLWWPPAAGWWIVFALVLILLLMLPLLLRWWRYQPLKRVALKQLTKIRQQYRAGQDESVLQHEVTALLRRVTISYYGRTAAAALTGEPWARQLQQLAPDAAFSDDLVAWLGRGRYQPDSHIDTETLLFACERWLRHLPRSKHRVSA